MLRRLLVAAVVVACLATGVAVGSSTLGSVSGSSSTPTSTPTPARAAAKSLANLNPGANPVAGVEQPSSASEAAVAAATAGQSALSIATKRQTKRKANKSKSAANRKKTKKTYSAKKASQRATAKSAPISVYEWRRLDQTSLAAMTRPFVALRKFGVTRISLDLSYVVDLSEIADPTARSHAQTAATAKLRTYMNQAHQFGLAVEALAGDPRWLEPEVRYVNQIVQRYVTQFNQSATSPRAPSQKLVGTHFDIEPWGRSDWANNRTQLTTRYLDTIRDITAYQHSLPVAQRVPITLDLPFWWDGTSHPKTITYQGKTASPTAHVMRLLDLGKQAGNKGAANRPVRNGIAVMSYRDKAQGVDGSIAISTREFQLARKLNGRVEVAIAQEVAQTQPARTTFYEEGSGTLRTQLNTLAQRFATEKSWNGFAVDHAPALAELLAR